MDVRTAQALLQALDVAVAVLDTNDRITEWNPTAEHLFGRSAADVLGRTADELWPKGGVNAILVGDPRSTQPSSEVLEWAPPGGPIASFSVRRVPVIAGDGTIAGVASTVRLASWSRRLTDFLRESEERFRLSFEHSPTGIALIDLAGLFVSANPAFCELLGHEQSELTGRSFLDFIAIADDEMASAQRLRRGEASRFQGERRYTRADGRSIWLQHNVSLVKTQIGEPLYYIVQAHDITERRELAYAMEAANEQLRMLDETRTRFLAEVSHEFRSPLTAILGYAHVLTEEEPDPETLKMGLETIGRQAERLKRLVEDLLTLSRADAGIPVDVEPVGLMRLAETVLRDCSEDFERWALRGDDVVALGDPFRFVQIVANLVTNAERYGEPPYEISLCQETNGTATLTVSDSGGGVSAEFVPLLFERFTRSQHSKHVDGLGLGLAISRALAQSMGNDLEYQPNIPLGASFVLSIRH